MVIIRDVDTMHPKTRGGDPQLVELLDEVRSRFPVPGIAVAIMQNGQERCAASGVSSVETGEALTVNDRGPISCVMKVLVSWLILYAESIGRIELSDDIGSHIPEILEIGRKSSGISVQNLLTHTAGYIEPQENSARWGYNLDRFFEFFPRRDQVFKPGSIWSYTHTGHVLLAVALERVFRKSVDDLLRDILLCPLGIIPRYLNEEKTGSNAVASLHIRNPKSGTYNSMRPPQETQFLRYSISDALLSVRDLALIGSALAGDFKSKLAHLESARRQLLSAATPIPCYIYGMEGEQMPQAFCHGLADYGTFKGVNGSYVGSTCAVRLDERSVTGLAIFVNAYEPFVRDIVTRSLTSLLFGSGLVVAQPTRVMPLWSRMVGRYQGLMLGSSEALIEMNGDQLIFSVNSKRGPSMTCQIAGTEHNWEVRSSSPGLTLAFGEDLENRRPYLMITTSAYRRM